jgi:hypothetical protein
MPGGLTDLGFSISFVSVLGMQLDPSSPLTTRQSVRFPVRLPSRPWVTRAVAVGLLAGAALVEASCSVSGMTTGQPAASGLTERMAGSSIPVLSQAFRWFAPLPPAAPMALAPEVHITPLVEVVIEAPAPEPVPEVPAEPALPYAEPTGAPFIPEVERWRGTVRMLIEEARAEGRLKGHAGKLDENLVLAVIQQESSGDPNAQSWAGARGLMQLMPPSFAWIMGIRNWGQDISDIDPNFVLDPHTNLRAGIRFLGAVLEEQGGSVYWALASYNAGGGVVNIWRVNGYTSVPEWYWETAHYVPTILNNYLAHK